MACTRRGIRSKVCGCYVNKMKLKQGCIGSILERERESERKSGKEKSKKRTQRPKEAILGKKAKEGETGKMKGEVKPKLRKRKRK